ncbi:hypothetical protein FRC02_007362 [Tulasnella sp. 418]|nr:hypothetical protein FRC02_007362 [Tulasnella sp. 418]
MDTTTCMLLANAYVEIWHANATGFYGGFTTAPILGPPSGGQTDGVTMSSVTNTMGPTGTESTSFPSGTDFPAPFL